MLLVHSVQKFYLKNTPFLYNYELTQYTNIYGVRILIGD